LTGQDGAGKHDDCGNEGVSHGSTILP
jgi:hypothetical protein